VDGLEPLFVAMALFLAMALGFGFLTWVSRNVWQSRPRTRLFALFGVGSTLAFVLLVMVVVP